MKLGRNKNKKRDDGGNLKHPNKVKRICKGFSNHGMLGKRY
jgi:hypothetical protein